MPKITPSFRWSLLAFALGLSACKPKLPETKAVSAASAVTAPSTALAAPLAAPPPPAAPAPTTSATPAIAQAGVFDINSVPLAQKPMPPFPYLDWPSELPPAARRTRMQEFDRRYVVAGEQARAVEGHIEWRSFANSEAKLSNIGAVRNYENALKTIGATKVDAMYPFEDKNEKPGGGTRMDIYERFHLVPGGSYSAWLVRTPEKNVWLSLSVSDGETRLMTIEEKPMTQSVGVVH